MKHRETHPSFLKCTRNILLLSLPLLLLTSCGDKKIDYSDNYYIGDGALYVASGSFLGRSLTAGYFFEPNGNGVFSARTKLNDGREEYDEINFTYEIDGIQFVEIVYADGNIDSGFFWMGFN